MKDLIDYRFQDETTSVFKKPTEDGTTWLGRTEDGPERCEHVEDITLPPLTVTQTQEKKRGRGRPKGTPGGGKFNATTTPVRVPVKYKDKIVKLVNLYEELQAFKTDWEERIETAAKNSKTQKPSPRYDQAMKLLEELDNLL